MEGVIIWFNKNCSMQIPPIRVKEHELASGKKSRLYSYIESFYKLRAS